MKNAEVSSAARALRATLHRWWPLQILVTTAALTFLFVLAREVLPHLWLLYFLFTTVFGAVYGLSAGFVAAVSSMAGLIVLRATVQTGYFPAIKELVFAVGGLIVNGVLVGFLADQMKRQTSQLRTDNEVLTRQQRELQRLNDELKRKEQELQTLAITDDLTNVYNHRYFWERLHQEMGRAKRYQRPLSCIMLDLDRFKQINDRYGHLCGDQVLAGLSSLLKQALRGTDVLARYGGEEFAIILPETGLEQATSVAERIRQLLHDHNFTYDDHVVQLTASLGVAEMTESAELDVNALVKQADDSMYRAKMMGGDRVVPATPLG